MPIEIRTVLTAMRNPCLLFAFVEVGSNVWYVYCMVRDDKLSLRIIVMCSLARV